MKNNKLMTTLLAMGLMTAMISQPFTVFGSEGAAQLYLTDTMEEPVSTEAVNGNTIKLELDANGDVIGKEAFSLNPASIDYSTLDDGLYVMYRGADWVFGNDGSLEMTFQVDENTPQAFSKSLTHSTEVRKSQSASLDFDFGYVKAAISQAYEISIADEVTKQAELNMSVPSGKEGYFKVYSTYTRFDIVRISNGNLSHSAETYVFSGIKAISVIVDAGDLGSIDTNELVIKEDTCLIQEVNDSIWQIIDNTPYLDIITTGREGNEIFRLNDKMLNNSFIYQSDSCTKLNLIFKIEEAGDYIFYVGPVVNLDLSSLNVNARDQITRIEFKKADGSNNNYIKRYLEGGNYVITLSNLEDISNVYSLLIQKK